MRVLTDTEAQAFLLENNLGTKLGPLDRMRARTEVTADVGRRCVYAKLLTAHFITAQSSVACIDITDWAVWPSSQNLDLFYSYRKYLGETRPLIEAHFHVFTSSEANEFCNILHLGLISLFNVAAASTTTELRVYASHDEWIDVAWFDGAPWRETMERFLE